MPQPRTRSRPASLLGLHPQLSPVPPVAPSVVTSLQPSGRVPAQVNVGSECPSRHPATCCSPPCRRPGQWPRRAWGCWGATGGGACAAGRPGAGPVRPGDDRGRSLGRRGVAGGGACAAWGAGGGAWAAWGAGGGAWTTGAGPVRAGAGPARAGHKSGAARADRTEAPRWAAPRTAPRAPAPLPRAPTRPHRPARWPSPTCSHLSSRPRSFSRSGSISTPTVTIPSCRSQVPGPRPSPRAPPRVPAFLSATSTPGWLQNRQLESLSDAPVLPPNPYPPFSPRTVRVGSGGGGAGMGDPAPPRSRGRAQHP